MKYIFLGGRGIGFLIAAFFLVLPLIGEAGISATAVTKISSVEAYTNYGNGDVTFKVDNPASGCEAYWLSSENANGYKTNLGILLSAFHTQSNVTIQFYDDQFWSGTSGKYCKIYILELVR